MILQAIDITKEFRLERGLFKAAAARKLAVDRASFRLEEFTTLGIVGESGSGKTTLAKILLKLIPPTSGRIMINDSFIRDFRKDVQIVFQNPYNSLDPKMRIADALYEPLVIHRICPKAQLKHRAAQLLAAVGLEPSALGRYPAQFSGGQRQRICIARAMACEPKLVVLDEPISSLDLTIQAKLLELFIRLKDEFKLTYIFISHNLAVIKHIADRVLVMQSGRIIEQGVADKIFRDPQEEYTRTLISAIK